MRSLEIGLVLPMEESAGPGLASQFGARDQARSVLAGLVVEAAPDLVRAPTQPCYQCLPPGTIRRQLHRNRPHGRSGG